MLRWFQRTKYLFIYVVFSWILHGADIWNYVVERLNKAAVYINQFNIGTCVLSVEKC